MVSVGQKLAKSGKSDVLPGVGGHNSNLHKDRIASQYHASSRNAAGGGVVKNLQRRQGNRYTLNLIPPVAGSPQTEPEAR